MSSPPLKEVADQIFKIELPIPLALNTVNCYLLKGDDENVLVDCGMDFSKTKHTLLEELKKIGVQPTDIQKVVLTHVHLDHCGLTGFFERNGAEILVLDKEMEGLKEYEKAYFGEATKLLNQCGVPSQHIPHFLNTLKMMEKVIDMAKKHTTFSDGDILELAGMKFKVIWTPGHAPGHATLLREADYVFLSGDHILPKITPQIGKWGDNYINPLDDFLTALDRLDSEKLGLTLPGHRYIIDQPYQRIQELKEHHRIRLERTKDFVIKGGKQSVWEGGCQLFPGFDPSQFSFAVSETFAHLVYLEKKGEIEMIEGEVVYFK